MKTLIGLILSLVFYLTPATAETSKEQYYLKIILENQHEISYPPGTSFVAENREGNAVLNLKLLEELKEYKVTEPITLYVFTSWNVEPDTFELTNGKLVMAISDYAYDHNTNYDFKRTRRGHSNKKEKSVESLGAWRGSSNGVNIINERFFSYDEMTGYDASLEFSNGVVFYYRDGKAEAWQNGKELSITGKFLIETSTGIIKLSYNPSNKEIWYVFEKN
jgi:hypothetical protein